MFARLKSAHDVARGFLGGALRKADRQHGIRIFRYHGVIEKLTDALLERNQHLLEVFRAQMRYLRRFHVLGLDELLETLERPDRATRSARSAAVVTFDDGFANNLMVAEVMRRFGLPWCLFVSVGEVGDTRAMWLDELSLLLLAGDAREIEALGARWPLTSHDERERAFRQLRPLFKSLPGAATRQAMAEIRAQYPADEPRRLIEKFPGLRMLNWKELGELARMGAEIGSHGVHHDMHHSWQPLEERVRELCDSRRELESRLNRPCRSFAFPNGDYLAESAEEAASAGYAIAFTTDGRTVAANDSRFLLPRLAAPRSLQRFVRVHWFKDPPPAARSAAIAEAGA
jgi:peptidoglycan/xylan/chitin deacetylase (PgdA/CDA1 family)